MDLFPLEWPFPVHRFSWNNGLFIWLRKWWRNHLYPGSGVVLDCIDSWSLHPYLLSITVINIGHALGFIKVSDIVIQMFGASSLTLRLDWLVAQVSWAYCIMLGAPSLESLTSDIKQPAHEPLIPGLSPVLDIRLCVSVWIHQQIIITLIKWDSIFPCSTWEFKNSASHLLAYIWIVYAGPHSLYPTKISLILFGSSLFLSS